MGRSVQCVCLAAVLSDHGEGREDGSQHSNHHDRGAAETSGRQEVGEGEDHREGEGDGGSSNAGTREDDSSSNGSNRGSRNSGATARTTSPRAALQVVGSLDVSVRTLGSNEILPGVSTTL